MPDNWLLFIAFLTVVVIVTRCEEYAYPEEYSFKKLASRVIGLIAFVAFFFMSRGYLVERIFGKDYYFETGDIRYIQKFLLISIGGLMISVITQIIMLCKERFH